MKEENKHPKPVCQPDKEALDYKYQEEMKNACRGYISDTATYDVTYNAIIVPCDYTSTEVAE